MFNLFDFLLIREGVKAFWTFDLDEGAILLRLRTLADFLVEVEHSEAGAKLANFPCFSFLSQQTTLWLTKNDFYHRLE